MLSAIERRECGREIRDVLSTGDNLKRLYTFFMNLCGDSSGLDVEKFRQLIKVGDRRRVWSLSGVTMWSVPFILLQLGYFKGINEKGEEVGFHFSLKEKKNTSGRSSHSLNRFLRGGVPLNYPVGSPYPMTKEIWEKYSKNYHWLNEEKHQELLKGLESAFDKKSRKKWGFYE